MGIELKFRALEKATNKIFKVATVYSDMSCEIQDGDTLRHLNAEDVKIMQYTGLKDKNGECIYIGDILERKDENICFFTGRKNGTYTRYRFIVEWDESNARFRMRSIQDGVYSHEFSFEYLNAYYAVIGNIYENENLIKDK